MHNYFVQDGNVTLTQEIVNTEDILQSNANEVTLENMQKNGFTFGFHNISHKITKETWFGSDTLCGIGSGLKSLAWSIISIEGDIFLLS